MTSLDLTICIYWKTKNKENSICFLPKCYCCLCQSHLSFKGLLRSQFFLHRIIFPSVERCGTAPDWTPVTQWKMGKSASLSLLVMSPHPAYAVLHLKASGTFTRALNRLYSVVSLGWHTMLALYICHSGSRPACERLEAVSF